MRSFDKASIVAAIDENEAVLAIEHAFRDHSSGHVLSFPPGHLRFDRPPGDFHVKGAHIAGRPYFTIKLASSFFDNPKRGLPSSNGLMLVFNAESGEPVATLLDEGLLTDLRTAIAGSIAARLIAPPNVRQIGIVGAGTQAAMQARWVARLLGNADICIWARDPARAEALAASLRSGGQEARAVPDLNILCARSDVIVTTTPSSSPLVGMEHLRPGLRVVAIGADATGKRELSLDLVEAADVLLVDSRSQCLAYGDCAGISDPTRLIEIGEALSRGPTLALPSDAVAIADLTGIGVQDAAIAELAWRHLTAIA